MSIQLLFIIILFILLSNNKSFYSCIEKYDFNSIDFYIGLLQLISIIFISYNYIYITKYKYNKESFNNGKSNNKSNNDKSNNDKSNNDKSNNDKSNDNNNPYELNKQIQQFNDSQVIDKIIDLLGDKVLKSSYCRQAILPQTINPSIINPAAIIPTQDSLKKD